jgi:hypothetical protein
MFLNQHLTLRKNDFLQLLVIAFLISIPFLLPTEKKKEMNFKEPASRNFDSPQVIELRKANSNIMAKTP